MSIFQKNIMLYSFLCLAFFYSNMTITMVVPSSTTIVLPNLEIKPLAVYHNNFNNSFFAFTHSKEPSTLFFNSTKLISLLEKKFLSNDSYLIIPLYSNQLFCVLSKKQNSISEEQAKQEKLNEYYFDTFSIDNKKHFVYFNCQLEYKVKRNSYERLKSYCEAIYSKSDTNFFLSKPYSHSIHDFHFLAMQESLQDENVYFHSVFRSNREIYYHPDNLLSASIKIDDFTFEPHDTNQLKLLISGNNSCKYIFILNKPFIMYRQSFNKDVNKFFIYGYSNEGKLFTRIDNAQLNNITFFKELFYEIFKKKYGLEMCKDNFLKDISLIKHELIDIVYTETEDQFIVSLLQKNVLEIPKEKNLDKRCLYSVSQYTLSKEDSSEKPICKHWLVGFINDEIGDLKSLFFSKKDGFKNLFNDSFEQSNNKNINDYTNKHYELFPIENVMKKSSGNKEAIVAIAYSMIQNLEKNNDYKGQLLLTDGTENTSNNQMVLLNSSTVPRQLTVNELFTALFNVRENKNSSQSKKAGSFTTIKLENSSKQLLQQLMDRLNTIERRYADFKNDYCCLTKTVECNKNNLDQGIEKLNSLHETIKKDLEKSASMVKELQEKISALEEDKNTKVGRIEKKYELLVQNLTESIKKYKAKLTKYKADILDTNNLIDNTIKEKIESYLINTTETIKLFKEDITVSLEKTKKNVDSAISTVKSEYSAKDRKLHKRLQELKTNTTSDRYLLYGALATITFLICWNGYLHQQLMAQKTAATL